MTKGERGHLAVLKAQETALKKGWLVSVPTNPCRYDLVLDDKTRLWRAQVKYGNRATGHSTGAVRVDLRRHGKIYTGTEIDVLLVYLPVVECLCWFESETFAGRKDLHIRFQPAKNGQRSGCLFVEDHVW